MYGGSDFQSNNIEKLQSHKYLKYFWNFLWKNLLLIRLTIITLFQLLAKIYEQLAKKLIVIPQHNLLVSAILPL